MLIAWILLKVSNHLLAAFFQGAYRFLIFFLSFLFVCFFAATLL